MIKHFAENGFNKKIKYNHFICNTFLFSFVFINSSWERNSTNPNLNIGFPDSVMKISPQDNEITAIPGTRKIHRLEENLGALNVDLSEKDLNVIAENLPAVTVGARY